MKEYLKHYRATLTVLGPLHISSGQTVGKKEYIFDSERHTVFIPKLPLMYQWILRNGKQESFEDFMLRDKVDFAAWLQRERIPRKVWEERMTIRLFKFSCDRGKEIKRNKQTKKKNRNSHN